MAPPRWKQGWTDGQSPPPPGTVALNGASPVLVRVGGAGAWTMTTFGQVQPTDTVLVLDQAALPSPLWKEAALPAAGIILAQ